MISSVLLGVGLLLSVARAFPCYPFYLDAYIHGNNVGVSHICQLTVPDYLGMSWILRESTSLLYGPSNLQDKSDLLSSVR